VDEPQADGVGREKAEVRISHWFVEGTHLGQSPRTVRFVHANLQWPDGLLFYCPNCGEAWARIAVEGSKTYAYAQPCRKCPGHYGAIPGSVWIDWDADYRAAMPPRVLARELRLHLEAWDKGEL